MANDSEMETHWGSLINEYQYRYVSTVTLQQQRSFLTWEMLQCFSGGLRCGDDAFGIVWGCLKTYVPWLYADFPWISGLPHGFFPLGFVEGQIFDRSRNTHHINALKAHFLGCRDDSPPLFLFFIMMNLIMRFSQSVWCLYFPNHKLYAELKSFANL